MRYRVELSSRATRGFDELPAEVRRRVRERIDGLAEDPHPRDAVPVKGPPQALWRLRVGDWRISFSVDDQAPLVRVVEIGHRRSIYQRLRRRQ